MSHVNELGKYKTELDFVKAYTKTDFWLALKKYANPSQQILLNKLESQKAFIQTTLLANIARFKWYKQGYYRVLNIADPSFQNMTFVMN